jgi:hypothetical protein
MRVWLAVILLEGFLLGELKEGGCDGVGMMVWMVWIEVRWVLKDGFAHTSLGAVESAAVLLANLWTLNM